MKPALLALTLLAACAPALYTPAARPFSLDTPTTPAVGHQDVQADVGHGSEIFGPDIFAGSGRLRHAVSEGVVVEGEAGVMRVLHDGTRSDGSSGYTGRGGVMLRSEEDGAVRGALTAGLGGGYAPVAGGWGSVDVGLAAAGTNHWFRPLFGVEGMLNHPIGAKTFTVSFADGAGVNGAPPTPTMTTLRFTDNGMLRFTFGFEVGPPDRALLLGMSLTQIMAASDGVVSTTNTDPPAKDRSPAFMSVSVAFRMSL
jgi:hypothetical protein